MEGKDKIGTKEKKREEFLLRRDRAGGSNRGKFKDAWNPVKDRGLLLKESTVRLPPPRKSGLWGSGNKGGVRSMYFSERGKGVRVKVRKENPTGRGGKNQSLTQPKLQMSSYGVSASKKHKLRGRKKMKRNYEVGRRN